MGVYRRGESPFWIYEFTVDGVRYRGSTRLTNKKTAERYANKLKQQVLEGEYASPKTMTIREGMGKYCDSKRSFPSHRSLVCNAKRLKDGIGGWVRLDQLTNATLANYRDKRLSDGVKPGTVNRELRMLRAMMNKAESEWGIRVAKISWGKVSCNEPAGRTRWLRDHEFKKLFAELPEHLRPPFIVSLMTGLRRRDVISLDWSQVDLSSKTIHCMVKNRQGEKKPHIVAISKPVEDVLMEIGPQTHGRVFLYQGKPFEWFDQAWRKARERAGMSDLRWHDLRHTCASWMVQSGVAIEVVKEALGHADIKTTMRYAHHRTEAVAKAMDTVSKRIEGTSS